MSAVEIGLAVLAATSLGYLAAALGCFARWARPIPADAAPPGEAPISFLRPLKAGVPELREILTAHLRAMSDADQVLYGVEPDSAEARLCEELRTLFPKRDLVIVPCRPGAARNPKISKLIQMSPLARHERWIVADSEAWLDAKFLADFRREWITTGADALTAGYRFSGLRSWPQRLDAVATLVTLWPGLAVLAATGKLTLTLGACTGLHGRDLEEIGGWMRLGNDLAEDNRLGALLAARRRSVRLSRSVVTLASDPLGWRDWWRHQRRVAVTYRAANPLGFAASLITHGEAWALLLSLRAPRLGLGLFLAVWGFRTVVARLMARQLDFSLPCLAFSILGASFAGTLCWLGCWLARSVWWGGRWRRGSFRGKLTEI